MPGNFRDRSGRRMSGQELVSESGRSLLQQLGRNPGSARRLIPTGRLAEGAGYEELRQCLLDLEQYEDPFRRLGEADRLIDQERAALSRAEEACRERRHRQEADNE